jgi:hypothetical protein
LQTRRVTPPPPNFRQFAVPTTPELLQSVFVTQLIGQAEGGRIRLSATLAKHLLGYLRGNACLTPEDRELARELRVFTGEWDIQLRRAWRALTFRQARAGRTRPVLVEDRRREPKAREARPARTTRTAAVRGSPGSRSSSEDGDPEPLDALRGFQAASERMCVHIGRQLAAGRVA